MGKIGFRRKKKGGRPSYSVVRNRVIEILKKRGVLHGYAIYKIYKELYGNVTMRNIYYNLYKAVEEGKVICLGFEKMKGLFSWGEESKRRLYMLGYNNEDFGILSQVRDKKIIEKLKEEVKKKIKEVSKEVDRFAIMISLNEEEKRRKKEYLESKLKKILNWISNIALGENEKNIFSKELQQLLDKLNNSFKQMI